MISENYEDELREKLALPHVFFANETPEKAAILAWHVLSLSNEEVLLMTPFAFTYGGVLAGLKLEHIEHIAKNAPDKYKKELIEAINKDYIQREMIEIAKEMDDDLGNSNKNQIRIKSVLQYISDNKSVFIF
jgi:hypothetical protein